MEGNNWRPASGSPAEPSAAVDGASGDWRSQLQPEARQRIVNKIMDTLKRHLPISVPEGINELNKIAVRFEEKIYTAATNQPDYLRKISLKMLSMETKTQGTAAINPSLSNHVVGNQGSVDSGTFGMQSQVGNQGQSSAMPLINESQVRQPLLPQNLQNDSVSAALQGSTGLASALPSIAGLNQATKANVGQTSNLQNMPGVSQNSLNNSAGQGVTQNMYTNPQRQIQGRQQQPPILSQQQQQSQSQLIYQQQLQQHMLKQKMQHPSLLQPHMQQQQQQQHQSLLQPNQLQTSQQPMMQMASSLQTAQSAIQQAQPALLQSGPQSNLQQNQQNAIQQSIPSLLQQHPQSIARQQQAQPAIHQQSSSLQQQSAPIPQQMVLPSQQQQQQLMAQQSNMQQTQLLGQQSNVSDIQQQQRLSGQSNNLMSMQQPQQMLNQQAISLHHQQQLGSQNNISGLQQQQLLGSQSSVSSMQPHQRSMHVLPQTKTVGQQQNQQSSLTLLQSQGQQSQLQSSQQQMMSQIQSQPPQLQQQLAMQQQPTSLQREMQQRHQTSGGMLHPQNTIEPQKQSIQSQRGLQEASSSTSMDSTTQTGHASAVDWQEEIYQKIKFMKDSYFAELNELYHKIALKLQQHEALIPPARQSDQFGKMKSFKLMLEHLIALLQVNKSNIQPGLKGTLPQYEKQIMGLLASNRNRKIAPSPQQGQQQFQHLDGHAHSMPQQQPSQVSQLQQHDNHINQAQLQGSVASMESVLAPNMQHGSVPLSTHVTVPAPQANMANALQPTSNLDTVQGSSFSSLQQGALGSVQQGGGGSLQNTINAPQSSSIDTLLQGTINTLQSDVGPLPSGSNLLQNQHLKQQQQEQQQQLMQTQQKKQQLQHRHIQQLMQQQQQQKQQILQQSQQVHQQKQHQTVQMPVHQLPQLHQTNDINELKARQGSGIKPGLYQQHYSVGQRHHYYHQQLKTGASFPISSPQNLQVSSPQISQHPSPQIDQHSLLSSHQKVGTPLQSANSPFIVPSPSTPIAPSPIPGDSEKLSGIPTLTNAVNIGHQQTALALPQNQSLFVGTPGISASPLLAESTSPDGSQVNGSTAFPGKSSTTERPVDRLIKMVQSLSSKSLSSSISDIGSVVSMIDRIAGSAPGNGSRAAVGEDLVAMTKCRLQARNFMSQDGNAMTKKMKRHISAVPLNAVSTAGSVNDSFKQSYGLDTSELESTATAISSARRQKVEVSHALLEEIGEINQQLIDTVVSISDEDVDLVAASTGVSEGVIVKFSISALSLRSNLKSQFALAKMSPIMPLRLMVPPNYPKCSPVLVDKLQIDSSMEFEDLSIKAQSRFSISLRCLPQPMSLGEMARTWDICARKVITEYAQQSGGGSFSSRYGAWENCASA